MKIINMIIGLSLLLSFSVNADSNNNQRYSYIDLSFAQEVIQISKKQTVFAPEALIQTIADNYAYYGLGDDGIDCPTKIFNLEITKEEESSLEFTFDSQQDYAGNWACFSWPVRCNIVMAFGERTQIDCQ